MAQGKNRRAEIIDGVVIPSTGAGSRKESCAE